MKQTKKNKETTFKFDAVTSGDSSYSPNVLGRPTTKHTEKVVQKHTTKFKHQTRVVNMLLIERLIKTAANSLAVGGGDNVILRGKDEIKILQ